MSFNREFYQAFLLGCSLGVLFTILYSEIIKKELISCKHYPQTHETPTQIGYSNLINEPGDSNHPALPVLAVDKPHRPIIFNKLDKLHSKGGDQVARSLARQVRILCWVMTQPKTIRTKGQAVKDTWGKRCNVLIFISSQEDKDFPAVGLNVPEGRENLWLKTRAAWKYIYDNHFNDADWFIKADDDSFVILENLRYLVSHYNSSDAHYFGRHFVPYGGYNSGGAGYIFSKETLIRFVRAMKDPSRCRLKSPAEDKEVGVCLAATDVYPGDTRDELGRETFHPFRPQFHLISGGIPKNNWLHKYSKWEVKTGQECCSDHSIAFHYIQPYDMYVMEYFIYHLHPFGIHHIHD